MSSWYPFSGITFGEYLQANSLAKDVTGQIKSSCKAIEVRISDQTKALVANNEQLAKEFLGAFNAATETIMWGYDQFEDVMLDTKESIGELRASFDYHMALFLQELNVHSKLLTDMCTKLDAIHNTLKNPTLTQAREFYHIGCERLSKGLLDKALEAFIEAEKKDNADFFIQFQIGKLYLYGIDEDDNLLDLQKAKRHLLIASRFAKAEISVDPTFARFAAEALLHASIATYAQLGEKNILSSPEKTKELLEEARRLSSEATTLHPQLFEAFYHTAKYSALLNEPEVGIPNLETAIQRDRNYAVKVDIDHAFDPIRPHVLALLSRLQDAKKIESRDKLKIAEQLLEDVSTWHPEESGAIARQFSKCKEDLEKAKSHIDSKTYFGFLDAILILDQLIVTLPKLKTERIEELNYQANQSINSAKDQLPPKGVYSFEVEKAIIGTNDLLSQAEYQINQGTYEAFKSALSLLESANLKSAFALKKSYEEDEAKKVRQEQERKRAALQKKRNKWSKQLAKDGALLLGLILGLGGCINYIYRIMSGKGDGFDPISGLIIGAIIGAILGAIIGQLTTHPDDKD